MYNFLIICILSLLWNTSAQATSIKSAYFAGGCFWCMEPPFEELDGVISVESGYMGGKIPNPTYEDVSSGKSGHIEVVRIQYDSKKISYEDLLVVFWKNINPTDKEGQFVDRGEQYTSGVFYESDIERLLFVKSRDALAKQNIFSKPIASFLRKKSQFYKAEDYHQDYYKTNPIKYKFYRHNSGRDDFLKNQWASKTIDRNSLFKLSLSHINRTPYRKPASKDLKRTLSPIQYKVTQEDGTEPPFKNEYWNHKEAGIYVDIVSGEPLFSSLDKYDSKTGWPSFTKPLEPQNIVEKKDTKLFQVRIEVRSKKGDSHLGHVFDDGPLPTKRRYCINSAALKFIPAKKLKESQYKKYHSLFFK